eukprot:Nitzschia sp. Nitz4//scaffold27_size158506//87913//89149//NITZ4_002604-RA/size158506-snap-gene-0.201-mRNA-1//1//CDS//3329545500//328//frame0
MCTNTDAKSKSDSVKSSPTVQRREDSLHNLNSSTTFKDVELGALVKSSSQDSNQSESSQASAVSWLSLKAITNGKVLSACVLYSFCSVSMVLANKSLASSYNHLIDGDLNILLVVFQAIVAVACVEFSKFMKWVEYPNFNLTTAKQWAPVNVFFCMMLFTGMAALQYNSVPMVTIFKNVTNIITTAGDAYFFDATTESLVVVAFGIMLSGAVAAAWNDIEVTWIGLFWMALNCVSTAGYVLYMKFATKNVKLSKFGMVFYNNLLCIFFLLPAAYMMGQVQVFFATDAIHTVDYFTKNVFAGFVGFFLNFASLNCVSVTGPTTYAIIGSVNKIPVAFLGYILFDNAITRETWFFICVSMAGGFLYSYAKIQTSRQKQPQSGK